MKSSILKVNKTEADLSALRLEKGLLSLKKKKFGTVMTFGAMLKKDLKMSTVN